MSEKCPDCKDGYNTTPGGTFRCNSCQGSGKRLSREDLIEQNEFMIKSLEKIKKETAATWVTDYIEDVLKVVRRY